MIHTHQTAPTQFIEANGIRFAYRRFGKPDVVPLVFNQHFTGRWTIGNVVGFPAAQQRRGVERALKLS